MEPTEPSDPVDPSEPTDPSSSGPVTVDQGEKTVWSLTAEFDIGNANQIQTVLWDFGFNDSDGQPVTSTEFSPRGIVFPGVGDYIVTLTMMNTIGSTVNYLLVHMMGDPFVFFETKSAEECRYYGEIPEDFDWLSFIKDSMTATLPVYRYFGSVNKLRIVARHSEYVQRRCPECGADIVLKNDFSQCECEPVRYLRRSTVRCFKDDIDLIRGYLAEHGSVFNSQGYSILDFGMSVPQCSTPETKGLQEYESDKTVEQRRAQRDKCIIYIPSERYGQGLDPVVISKSDLRTKRKELEEKYPEADIFSFIEV